MGGKRKGLLDRLNRHASGRRSGDQFCVYVFDRLLLPTLTASEIQRIADSELSPGSAATACRGCNRSQSRTPSWVMAALVPYLVTTVPL
jgi:hypothetical protein